MNQGIEGFVKFWHLNVQANLIFLLCGLNNSENKNCEPSYWSSRLKIVTRNGRYYANHDIRKQLWTRRVLLQEMSCFQAGHVFTSKYKEYKYKFLSRNITLGENHNEF